MPLQPDGYTFVLSDDVVRTPVRFRNRYGIKIAADLYQAKDLDASATHPALVVGPPHGGVKEQGPGVYAQELARRGFVAIGICGSGGFALSAAQVDPRIKAVATAAMYDISGVHRNGWVNSGTAEDRRKTLADIAAQRWADVDSGEPALTPPFLRQEPRRLTPTTEP